MADSVPKDRLQPALLDRLTDDEPDRALEPRAERLISRQHMRQSVLRDLGWLFNATRAADADNWPGAPLALRSVVNFGLPALAGETASTLDVIQLERAMRQAILEFEPRIDPGSLKLRALAEQIALDRHNRIEVEIRGSLWAQPTPIELLLRTNVDLETGQIEIQDLGR